MVPLGRTEKNRWGELANFWPACTSRRSDYMWGVKEREDSHNNPIAISLKLVDNLFSFVFFFFPEALSPCYDEAGKEIICEGDSGNDRKITIFTLLRGNVEKQCYILYIQLSS